MCCVRRDLKYRFIPRYYGNFTWKRTRKARKTRTFARERLNGRNKVSWGRSREMKIAGRTFNQLPYSRESGLRGNQVGASTGGKRNERSPVEGIYTYFRNLRNLRTPRHSIERVLGMAGSVFAYPSAGISTMRISRSPFTDSFSETFRLDFKPRVKCVELALSVNFYRLCQRVVPNINSFVNASVLSILSPPAAGGEFIF